MMALDGTKEGEAGDRPARYSLDETPDGLCLHLVGDWTATSLGKTPQRLAKALGRRPVAALSLAMLDDMDTSGAFVLARDLAVPLDLLERAAEDQGRKDVAHLSRLVMSAPPAPERDYVRRRHWRRAMVTLGENVEKMGLDAYLTIAFYGELVSSVGRVLRRPGRIRAAATVSQMERAGLDAVPIILTTNFFVGATIAFLGANLLAQFGAAIFTVELVGVGVLREFGVLITAVILAGRSSSSFAAEIGAMKMNQEVDAMSVMGVDRFDALVMPRFIAMLTMTPLLTFLAMIAGMAGGLMVIWAVIDLSPALFFYRLVENVGAKHFWIGMSKAPIMAIVIAAIGCRQGLEVGGDVEQLGRRVTTAVVQALFAIIVIDALFALLFMELNL
jgi:phospholipid/cholesterol/gamma-HCH transport system permease protein